MSNRLTSILTFLLAIGLVLGLSAPTVAANDTPPASPTKIVIEPEGNQMKFATTEFTVEPGEKVRLVFENTASSPAMIHNVVLLSTSNDAVVREVGQAGAGAGASADYVPDHDAILAATDVAKPGETVEVTFTAPEKTGEVTYVCTYPGHWATMQGTMRVAN
jgi:azurin